LIIEIFITSSCLIFYNLVCMVRANFWNQSLNVESFQTSAQITPKYERYSLIKLLFLKESDYLSDCPFLNAAFR